MSRLDSNDSDGSADRAGSEGRAKHSIKQRQGICRDIKLR
jgi:hypothetical protein